MSQDDNSGVSVIPEESYKPWRFIIAKLSSRLFADGVEQFTNA